MSELTIACYSNKKDIVAFASKVESELSIACTIEEVGDYNGKDWLVTCDVDDDVDADKIEKLADKNTTVRTVALDGNEYEY